MPTHIEVTATRLSWRRSSASAVTTCRAPVAPRGCPNALSLVSRLKDTKVKTDHLHGSTTGVHLGLVQAKFIDTVYTLGTSDLERR